MNVNRNRCWACGLLLGIGGWMLIASSRHTHNVQAANATVTEIIDETEPLCRAVVPDLDTLHFFVHSPPVYRASGMPRRLWMVECLDAEGNERVHILWNQEDKRVLGISRVMPVHAPKNASRIRVQDAVAAARTWAVRLHLASPEDVQKCSYRTQSLSSMDCVRLHLPSHDAKVWIEAFTGAFERVVVRDKAPSASVFRAPRMDAG